MNAKRNPAASPIPENVLEQLLLGLPERAPTAGRKAAMKKSILERVGKLAAEDKAIAHAADMVLIRADEGRWFTFAPHVEMKTLHDDGSTRTWLARFGPGGRIPAHMQSGDEEAIIMEGWCYLDDVRINQGDYHSIAEGARHGNIHSPEGCLIFVRSHSEKRHASELTSAR
ncbi:MAG: cupin domain-containing protein [Usitatibacteraceae bacterium]